MTPEERALAIQRLIEIESQLKALRVTVDVDSLRDWIALHREREALAKLLAG
jgi:hypothetical protein